MKREQPEPFEYHQQAEFDQPAELSMSEQIDKLAQQLEHDDRKAGKLRSKVGLAFVVGAVGVGGVVADGTASDLRFEQPMPFIQEAQTAINNVDNGLEIIGGIMLPVALGGVGYAKLRARRNPKYEAMDRWSSREMSDDSTGESGRCRRGLEHTFAGKLPVLAALGAGVAVFSSAIGSEVSNGPQRPIEKALSTLTPGNTMAVGFEGAMPMVESDLSRPLANNIIKVARSQNIEANTLDLNLGQISKGDQTLASLAVGIDPPAESPLVWKKADGCAELPIAVDKLANIDVNASNILLNGIKANVVAEADGFSATNRIGILMSQRAIAACLKKDFESPVHAIVLNTTPQNAEDILAQANISNEPSAVVTKEHYLENSEEFWAANVKPITNVLSVFSGLFAFAAMGAGMNSRLLRNRREWAAKSAAGVSNSMIRKTEMLRAAKDGVLASAMGIAGATLATPFIVNTLESGFNASVGFKEAMVGAGIGITGSMGGALKSLVRPQSIIKKSENTRV